MEMEKPQCQSEHYGNRREEGPLPQPDLHVVHLRCEVVTYSVQLADREIEVQPNIGQQQFRQAAQTRMRPSSSQPSLVYGKSQEREHEEVAPVSCLLRARCRKLE